MTLYRRIVVSLCLSLGLVFVLPASEMHVLAEGTQRPTIFIDPLASNDEVDQPNDKTLENSIQIATLLRVEIEQSGFLALLSTDTDRYRSVPQRRAYANNQKALVYVAIASTSGVRNCVHVYSPVARKEVWTSDDKKNETNAVVDMVRNQLDKENEKLASILQKKLGSAGACATTTTRRAAVLNLSMIPTVLLNIQTASASDTKTRNLDGDHLKNVTSAIAYGLEEFVPQIKTLKR